MPAPWLEAIASTDAAASPAADRLDTTSHRRFNRRPPSLDRSRIAAMILIRLIRRLVSVTVANAMRKPIAKPLTMLVRVTWNAIVKPAS